ncbi:MAG: hypothetical protein K2G79_04960, partial [Muribaculum sp.]|nr:hypothetical protein [Muribaculum sp.]
VGCVFCLIDPGAAPLIIGRLKPPNFWFLSAAFVCRSFVARLTSVNWQDKRVAGLAVLNKIGNFAPVIQQPQYKTNFNF